MSPHEPLMRLMVNLVSANEAVAQTSDTDVAEEVPVLHAAHEQDRARELAGGGEFEQARQTPLGRGRAPAREDGDVRLSRGIARTRVPAGGVGQHDIGTGVRDRPEEAHVTVARDADLSRGAAREGRPMSKLGRYAKSLLRDAERRAEGMTEGLRPMSMSCPHRATPVRMPDGTRILGSGVFERGPDDEVPDFGLYADERWQPTWPAVFIEWADFGLPTDPREASRLIVEAFDRARSGQTVEVGCHMGNGRTGTIIACMAILAGVAPKDAVAWTRSHYCRHAIDTPEQERWLEAFESAR